MSSLLNIDTPRTSRSPTTASRKSATFETSVEAVTILSPTERARSNSKVIQISEKINDKAPVATYTPFVVAFVLLLIIFLWGSFTFLRCPKILEKSRKVGIIFYSLISVATGLLLISYFRTMFTSSFVMDYETPIEAVELDFHKCQWCQAFKPDRTHHCSICDQCVLKMDHHCPFVANCVGFYNYKFFMLFLFWVNVGIVVIITGALYEQAGILASDSHDWEDTVSIAAFWVTIIIGIIVMIFFAFHVYLVMLGRTTLEYFVGIEPRIQKGAWHNFSQVFGRNPIFWLIPVNTSNATGFEHDPLLHKLTISDENTSVTSISSGLSDFSNSHSLTSPRGDV